METNPTTPLPQDQHVDSKDFRIHAVSLISSDGATRDISGLVQEIQIRQDMYLGFMSGDILLTDATGIYSLANMHGNEYIHLHITVPDQELAFKKAFRIYKMGDRQTVQESGQRYLLYFVSDEMFLSHMQKITKSYKATRISDIANDIMRNYLRIPSDRILIDQTSEPVSIIMPNYRPFEALNWLASRAFNTDKDICYFFFENLNGYNFRSLQSLYREGTAVKVPYKLESKGVSKKLEMDKYAIDEFDGKRDFDALYQVSNGGYAMKLLGVDPFSRNFTVNDYSVDELPTLYKNPAMTNPKENGVALFDRTEAHNLTYLQTEKVGTEEKNHTESWIRRVMALAALNNTLIEITVPGDPRLQAGALINIKLPYSTTPSDSDMWDKMKGGKYLILAANHKFDNVNHRYVSILLLGRDSLPESLPAPDAKLPDKIMKLNANSNRA